jgi:arylsulfatase A-like enzyme
MSFPDPHHPWDPPASEIHRVDWRDAPLPALFDEDKDATTALLATKPKHWLGYYDGSSWTNLESPRDFIPRDMTADQIREINAMTHIENELIDDACGRVIDWLKDRGWYDNTDIIFTTDHGEFQGDYGLLFKGPYHVDALMRLPMIWQPAASTQTPAAAVSLPVGHLDLASTFCEIAGIDTPPWVQGQCLPRSDSEALEQAREDVITEWDSEHAGTTLHLKSIYHKSGWLCTVYEKSSLYEGTEGELYDMNADPEQRVNLWDDPLHRATRDDLTRNLYDKLPRPREPRLPRQAPV